MNRTPWFGVLGALVSLVGLWSLAVQPSLAVAAWEERNPPHVLRLEPEPRPVPTLHDLALGAALLVAGAAMMAGERARG